MQLANVGLKTHHLNGWFSLRISMMVEIIKLVTDLILSLRQLNSSGVSGMTTILLEILQPRNSYLLLNTANTCVYVTCRGHRLGLDTGVAVGFQDRLLCRHFAVSVSSSNCANPFSSSTDQSSAQSDCG